MDPQEAPDKPSYVGLRLRPAGQHHWADPGLPAELKALGDIHTASGARIVPARLGDDLIILLAGQDSVVVDTVELPDRGADSAIVHGCEAGTDDDLVFGLVPAAACEGTVTASQAWAPRAGRLEPVAAHVECPCDRDLFWSE